MRIDVEPRSNAFVSIEPSGLPMTMSGPVMPSKAATVVPAAGETTASSGCRLNAPESGTPGVQLGTNAPPSACPAVDVTRTTPSAGNG